MNGGQEQLPKLRTSGPDPTFITRSDKRISSFDSRSTRGKSGKGLPENIISMAMMYVDASDKGFAKMFRK